MGFREMVNECLVILDGGTGTNLQKAGMPSGVCPEKWVLENPDSFIDMQRRYIEAGSDVLYSMTFSCNEVKLAEYGLEDKLEEMIIGLVGLSREAIKQAKDDREILVFGDISMTGKQLKPVGDMEFETLVNIYKNTVRAMEKAGVDGYAIETMMSLNECRAALLAVKELTDKPVLVTMTFESDGRALFGTEAGTAVSVLQAMGADAVGLNCSTGPDKMIPIIERMLKFAKVPVVVKPNAGVPVLKDGKTEFDLSPEEFDAQMKPIIDLGVGAVGGCCGTDYRYIEGLKKYADEVASGFGSVKTENDRGIRVLTTERNLVEIDLDGRFTIVGERINPTGKKALQAELREGSLDMVLRMAEEQVANGAKVLDVNMGMNGIDEKEMMLRAIEELTMTADAPLSIDSSDPEVIEAALRVYPGRALINSISLEPGKPEKLLPLAKKYGAMFILLPLTEEGLPKSMEEKHDAIDRLMGMAFEAGLTKDDIVVDGLVATVGANKNAALEVLQTIEHCKNDLGLATICGLSNISFGLPERSFINTAFLTMAISRGLTMAISNPNQTMLVNASLASDLLLAKDEADTAYIEGVKPIEVASGESTAPKSAADSFLKGDEGELFIAVMKGRKDGIEALADGLIADGKKPQQLIDEELIPAINLVGELYEKKIYFLPQLISSAQAMECVISHIEPELNKNSDSQKLETVIMATVEGDVHDIGKNLVVLMLKNYGYDVIDMGKDVPSDDIIAKAKETGAAVIGLSALMTTTMTAMKDVVELRNNEGLSAKVIIGGACVTEDYAKEIGADGYSEDAREAVKLVNSILGH